MFELLSLFVYGQGVCLLSVELSMASSDFNFHLLPHLFGDSTAQPLHGSVFLVKGEDVQMSLDEPWHRGTGNLSTWKGLLEATLVPAH